MSTFRFVRSETTSAYRRDTIDRPLIRRIVQINVIGEPPKQKPNCLIIQCSIIVRLPIKPIVVFFDCFVFDVMEISDAATVVRRRFSLAWLLQRLGLLRGKIENGQVSITTFDCLYSGIVQLFLGFIVIRHLLASLYSDNLVVSFYASNISFNQGKRFSGLHMLGFVMLAASGICNLRSTLHMNNCSKCIEWLLILVRSYANKSTSESPSSFTVTVSGLILPSHTRLERFFELFGFWFVRVLIVQSIGLIIIVFSYYGYIFYDHRDLLPFYWTVFALNFIIGAFYFVYCNYIVITLQFCLSFLCYMLRNDIVHLTQQLNTCCHPTIKTKSIRQTLISKAKNRLLFQAIGQLKFAGRTMLRANRFWSKVIGINYFFFFMLITIVQTLAWFSTNWPTQSSLITVVAFFYLLGFVAPLWHCGEVQYRVSTATLILIIALIGQN